MPPAIEATESLSPPILAASRIASLRRHQHRRLIASGTIVSGESGKYVADRSSGSSVCLRASSSCIRVHPLGKNAVQPTGALALRHLRRPQRELHDVA
jgi:hypothetical protein